MSDINLHKLNRIVVGTDFSEPSYSALDAASAWARREGASVFLTHVIDPLSHVDAVMGNDAVRTAMEEDSKRRLRELCDARFEGLNVEMHILYGPNAGIAMADFAERVDADLIVVGTHGRSGLRRILLGSVAESVTRVSPCSVLVART